MFFTYLIVNRTNKNWYYGARWAKKAKTNDIMKTYFTSSNVVKSAIEKYSAENFDVQIRRIFNTKEEVQKWEIKVLRRMRITNRSDCYNLSYGGCLPICKGFEKETKLKLSEYRKKNKMSLESIRKMQISLIKRNLLKWTLKFKYKIPERGFYSKTSLEKYLIFLNEYRPELKRIKCLVQKHYDFITNKETDRRFSSPSKERRENISNALRCKIWFTSPEYDAIICVENENDAPEGWIRGNKLKIRSEKIKRSSTGRRHIQETKTKLSRIGKQRIYATNPKSDQVKVFYDIKDIPNGWVRGNKSKIRNGKISSYLKTRNRGE